VRVLAILAALGSAACYALAATVQQREAERAPAQRLAAPGLLWTLAHRPWWVAAVGAMGIAASLHLWALAHAPLLVVQPIGVTGLVYAVVLAALLRSRWVSRAEILAAVTICAGLVGLLSVLPQQPGSPAPLPGEVVLVMGGAPVVLAALAVAAARRVPGTSQVGRTSRTVVLACAAAVALGTSSALARSLLPRLSRVGPAAVISWPTLIVVALALLGFWLAQCAYQAGNLGAAFAVITVVDPVTAGSWGVRLLHEPLPTSTLGVATLTASATLILTGIGVLATSRAARAAPGPTEPTLAAARRPAGTP